MMAMIFCGVHVCVYCCLKVGVGDFHGFADTVIAMALVFVMLMLMMMMINVMLMVTAIVMCVAIIMII